MSKSKGGAPKSAKKTTDINADVLAELAQMRADLAKANEAKDAAEKALAESNVSGRKPKFAPVNYNNLLAKPINIALLSIASLVMLYRTLHRILVQAGYEVDATNLGTARDFGNERFATIIALRQALSPFVKIYDPKTWEQCSFRSAESEDAHFARKGVWGKPSQLAHVAFAAQAVAKKYDVDTFYPKVNGVGAAKCYDANGDIPDSVAYAERRKKLDTTR